MAQFRGTVQGGRGEAARLGHASSGLTTTCRGWQAGVDVYASADSEGDYFGVYVNEGNGYNAGRGFRLGSVVPSDDGPVFIPTQKVVRDILLAHGIELAMDVTIEPEPVRVTQ